MRKPFLGTCENKDADQLCGKVISAFVFATQIVQPLYFLNPRFQASSHLLWLYSPVCVGPGRKPRRPVFSKRGSMLKQRDEEYTLFHVCGTVSSMLSGLDTRSLGINTLGTT